MEECGCTKEHGPPHCWASPQETAQTGVRRDARGAQPCLPPSAHPAMGAVASACRGAAPGIPSLPGSKEGHAPWLLERAFPLAPFSREWCCWHRHTGARWSSGNTERERGVKQGRPFQHLFCARSCKRSASMHGWHRVHAASREDTAAGEEEAVCNLCFHLLCSV